MRLFVSVTEPTAPEAATLVNAIARDAATEATAPEAATPDMFLPTPTNPVAPEAKTPVIATELVSATAPTAPEAATPDSAIARDEATDPTAPAA